MKIMSFNINTEQGNETIIGAISTSNEVNNSFMKVMLPVSYDEETKSISPIFPSEEYDSIHDAYFMINSSIVDIITSPGKSAIQRYRELIKEVYGEEQGGQF